MLKEITEHTHPILLDIQYAASSNFTGTPVYKTPKCLIHEAALVSLEKAIVLAAQQNLKLKIFDIFRPQKAQEALWAFCPNEMYIMHPQKGSVHTRGVAVDLTLVDASGKELDMGTPFDDLTEQSHHGAEISAIAAHNRYTLLGIMMTAGFDFYRYEWWHYQLFNPRDYPLILDDHGIM
jgi:D-alanyl-D-alanine dipeptidase